jgi:hypothetical protein
MITNGENRELMADHPVRWMVTRGRCPDTTMA